MLNEWHYWRWRRENGEILIVIKLKMGEVMVAYMFSLII